MDSQLTLDLDAVKPEEWRPVVGYEGYYEVSDQGRVRSLDRIYEAPTRWGKSATWFKPGRMLRQKTNIKWGYKEVNLRIYGFGSMMRVNRVVLEAFVGIGADGQHAAHWDGDRTNNKLINLRWATPLDNNADKQRHGTASKKITIEIARSIKRELFVEGRTRKQIAALCGTTTTVVNDIARGRTWKWA